MNYRLAPVVKGLLTWVPGLRERLSKSRTGGTDRAEYCYEVWLKHLTMAWEHGLREFPRVIAELGPGDSIGTGLAAMLTGVDRYIGLDVVEYSDTGSNIKIFEDLVKLLRERSPRPPTGFPDYDRYLGPGLFPAHILDEQRLEKALDEDRVEKIRKILSDPDYVDDALGISYVVPWTDKRTVEKESVDLVISQSVLEHVTDLERAYDSLHTWLRPGGMMSHQIDLGAHGTSTLWNGYRGYPEFIWKMIKGRRPYLINRQPCSRHIEMIERLGFTINCELRDYSSDNGIGRSELASRWKDLSEEDLTCRQMFIQAVRL